MLPSAFTARVPLASGDVFLLNTLTDAQAVVSADVAGLLDGQAALPAGAEAADAIATLAENGFIVADRPAEQSELESRFEAYREDASDLRLTILTTMRCNFACEYCYQGEHGGPGKPADTMSLAVAARTAEWIGRELKHVRPGRLSLTFFGGEPLLNPAAMFEIAGRCHAITQELGIPQVISIITNGFLLTPEIVERLLPYGLAGVKVTLDGDRAAHDRARPQRGGQGTFDRIVENMRRVAPLVPLTVGGNFDASTVESYPALLDFLRGQEFADRIVHVSFKPVVGRTAPLAGRVLPLTPVGQTPKPTGSPCSGGAGGGSVCDSCQFVDDQMAFLQGETRRRGFATHDGVHMGPCELYRRHSHTIGPDGSLFACPGFTGEHAVSVGHIDHGPDAFQVAAAGRVARLAPWRQCGDCVFIPVCGGGCAVAAKSELGDMDAPSCHKRAFEAALFTLAEDAAAATQGD